MSEGWGMEDKRKSIAEDGKGCAVKSSSPAEVDLDWAMDGKGKAEREGCLIWGLISPQGENHERGGREGMREEEN
jgi:hypothetical protein